jgi:hypothetical protein
MPDGLRPSRIYTSRLLGIEASGGKDAAMSLFAAAVKVAALSAALTCVGAGRPQPEDATRPTIRAAGAPHLQCRMYFGCRQAVSVSTAVAQQQEYAQ